MLELYNAFCSKYPIVTIEDPFEQDDWDPCTKLTAEGICQVGARWAGLGWVCGCGCGWGRAPAAWWHHLPGRALWLCGMG